MSRTFSASDPIASEIGHGALGMRDNLRPLDELVLASAADKQLYVRFTAGKLLFGWTSSSGAYYTPFSGEYGGVSRDVVGCKTEVTTLVRVDTLALCQATNDTFYFDPDADRLYVRVGAGTDPTGTDVMALVSLTFGSHSVAHPSLGNERLTDGVLEVWASSSNLTNWTEYSEGGAVGRDAGFDGAGSYSAKVSGTLDAGGRCGIIQGITTVVGLTYRLSGWYKTSAFNLSGIIPRVRPGTSGYGYELASTYGERRRFSIDFIADVTDNSMFMYAHNNTAGAQACDGVWFDGLSLKRVFRYDLYEPRLKLDSVPEIEERHTDAFYGAVARGSGTLTLVNGDGLFEKLFGGLDWMGQEFEARVGGRWPNGGNETLWEDCSPRLVGVVTANPRVSDMTASISFEDTRAKLARILPPQRYGRETFSALSSTFADRRRPLVFGSVTNAIPVCIDTSAGSTYGQWELLDMTSAPGGAHGASGLPTIWSYLDADSADKQDSNRRQAINHLSYGEMSWNNATGRLTFTRCPRVVEVTADNNVFEFDIGGGALSATVTPGVYLFGHGKTGDRFGLLDALATALTTAAGATFYCSLSNSTWKVTVEKYTGSFSILAASGTLRERSILRLLGFTSNTDYASAPNRTGDVVVYSDTNQLTLRADFKGYLDNSSGTYTGTSEAVIEKAPDIVRTLLIKWCGVPAERIDTASFVAGRSSCAQANAVYIGAPGEDTLEAQFVIERLCNASGADLVFEGDKFYWRLRERNVYGITTSLLGERDYVEFDSGLESEDTFSIVRVAYGQNPADASWSHVQQTVTRTALRRGREEQKTFPTYLAAQADATVRLDDFVVDATVPMRRASLRTKGSLLLKSPGTRLLLTRAKGVDPTGSLSAVPFRIVGKRDNLATWESSVDLIEVSSDAPVACFRGQATTWSGLGNYQWYQLYNGIKMPSAVGLVNSNERVRLPAGTYHVTAHTLTYGVTGGNYTQVSLKKNGTAIGLTEGPASSSAGEGSQTVTWAGTAAEGDYLTVENTSGDRYGSYYCMMVVEQIARG